MDYLLVQDIFGVFSPTVIWRETIPDATIEHDSDGVEFISHPNTGKCIVLGWYDLLDEAINERIRLLNEKKT